MIFEETGRICDDFKEMKVNSVTAVFAALPMGSVQSTHHMQSVVLDNPANTNTRINANEIHSILHFSFSKQNKVDSSANQHLNVNGKVSHCRVK